MLNGLDAAEKKEEKAEDKKEDKNETVANNIIAYLNLKQGGHGRYGTGFLVSQVNYLISASYVIIHYLILISLHNK